MQRINLRAVDLNLLVVFDAVMAERSVTRASERLHLTQPAVSHALSRLRALFKDPLFVRKPAGLEPTPRASRLAGRISAALAEIGAILTPGEGFDPATSDRQFIVGMSDYAAFVFMPSLAARLKARAPSVRLVVRHTSHVRGLATLDNGEAELIVGNFPKPPARIARELLFKEGFLCAARGNHPAFARKLTLRAYLGLEHLHVSLSGEPSGYIDDVLRRKKHHRTIALTVGHFLVAPSILATTDLVATEPTQVLRPAALQLNLATQPPPMTLPEFDVVQMWPRRLTMDEGHAWLRTLIAESWSSQKARDSSL
jgi:DNA-binding transcriptional LysR family regulator